MDKIYFRTLYPYRGKEGKRGKERKPGEAQGDVLSTVGTFYRRLCSSTEMDGYPERRILDNPKYPCSYLHSSSLCNYKSRGFNMEFPFVDLCNSISSDFSFLNRFIEGEMGSYQPLG